MPPTHRLQCMNDTLACRCSTWEIFPSNSSLYPWFSGHNMHMHAWQWGACPGMLQHSMLTCAAAQCSAVPPKQSLLSYEPLRASPKSTSNANRNTFLPEPYGLLCSMRRPPAVVLAELACRKQPVPSQMQAAFNAMDMPATPSSFQKTAQEACILQVGDIKYNAPVRCWWLCLRPSP